MEFTIEKVSNMVFVTSSCGVIFNAWDESEFTERKLANAIRKIQNNYNGTAVFERTF